jgi:hypothetical protein
MGCLNSDKSTEEFSQMAAAACNYLVIPASEVSVERLFSNGRDIIGLRWYASSPGMMRQLALPRDAIIHGGPSI